MLTEPVKISQTDMKKILSAASPDAALLYLYIQSGNTMENAEKDLNLNPSRLNTAAATLRQLGLICDDRRCPIAPGERPGYSEKDVLEAMEEDTGFRGLYGEVQRLLGRALNTEELKILLGFVRYLGMTPDLISVLVSTARTGHGRRAACGILPCGPSKKKPTPGRSGASTPWKRRRPLSRARTYVLPV